MTQPEQEHSGKTGNGQLESSSTREAGRALDALIAVKVMGWASAGERQMWSIGENGGEGEPDGTAWMGQLPANQRLWPEQSLHLPHYSTAMGHAWLVVEKVIGDLVQWQLDSLGFSGEEWRCLFVRGDEREIFVGEAPTAPLAICRAALAVGEAL